MFQWLKKLFKKEVVVRQTEMDIVLSYVRQYGSISTKEARGIGIKHLRSIICKMRKKGYTIKNVSEKGKMGVYKFK